MKFRTSMLMLAGLSLSACATVNMTDFGVSDSLTAQKQDNIVVKASSKLRDRFYQKKWVDEKATVKTAAMTLLKGRSDESVATDTYITNIDPVIFGIDITEATNFAREMVEAADVYLKHIDISADLSTDLVSLEGALLDCRKAQTLFQRTAKHYNLDESDKLLILGNILESLQETTDRYGAYVRHQNAVSVRPDAPIN